MWQYAVCRTMQRKGYEWGINSTTSHDYFEKGKMIYEC
jgi:hypothetical protein